MRAKSHGNVNLQNIFLSSDGSCWIYRDPFQFPYQQTSADNATTASAELQSEYAAPELALGTAPNSLTDIYASGCVLYQMLSGKVPFPADDMTARIHRHANDTPDSLTALGVESELEEAAFFMMAKNPEVRFPVVRHCSVKN